MASEAAAKAEKKAKAAAPTAPASPFDRIREFGLIVAMVSGAWVGSNVHKSSDLLDAVLRGAGAWLIVLVLWVAGVAICRALVPPAQSPDHPERNTPTAASDEPA